MLDILLIGEIQSAEFGGSAVCREATRYAVMYFRFETEDALRKLLAGNSIRVIPPALILEKGTLIPPEGALPRTGDELTSVASLNEAILVARRARANPAGFLASKGFRPDVPVYFMKMDRAATPVDID